MQETQEAWVRFLDQDNLEKEWHPTPVFLPEKSYEQRSLVGYSPWGRRELGIAERLSTHKAFICMYPFSPKFPSHTGCHIALSRIPCAVQ